MTSNATPTEHSDRPTGRKEEGMKIVTVGRGNIGGGLADLWERAGHQVTRLGHEGGDLADAEVVLMAVPGGAVADALTKLKGAEGKMVIDATNLYGVQPPQGFSSNAEFIKSKTNGPTAKSFNLNFASLFTRLGEGRARPGNFWCGDDETRQVVEHLNRDAGYDPIYTGPLENASFQEGMVKFLFAISQGMGPFVYRFAPVDKL
jgi:8-hydroxy-5-deazaflavin:NADPH oxidoreductase